MKYGRVTGLLSNQGEKSIHLYFIRVPLRKKVLKYGTPKPRLGRPKKVKGYLARPEDRSQQKWVVIKIMVPFGFFLYNGTYLGYPKRNHNFDNYPNESSNPKSKHKRDEP